MILTSDCWQFSNNNISQGSVGTREAWLAFQQWRYYKFTAESASEKILKAGQYLMKLF